MSSMCWCMEFHHGFALAKRVLLVLREREPPQTPRRSAPPPCSQWRSREAARWAPPQLLVSGQISETLHPTNGLFNGHETPSVCVRCFNKIQIQRPLLVPRHQGSSHNGTCWKEPLDDALLTKIITARPTTTHATYHF